MNNYFAGKSALIVDNSRTGLAGLRDIFGQFGLAAVATASSANMAASYLQEQTFDLCVAVYDLGRGEKNGLQILQEAILGGCWRHRSSFVLVAAPQQLDQFDGLLAYPPDVCFSTSCDRLRVLQQLDKLAQLKTLVAPFEDLLDQQQWDAALKQYQLLYDQHTDVRLYLQRLKGLLLLRQRRFEAARDLFSGLSEQPHVTWAQVGLGIALFHLGEYLDAQKWLSRVVDQPQVSPEAFLPLSRIHRILGQGGAALMLLRKAAMLQPTMPELQADLANMMGQSGDWASAAYAYREAVRFARYSPFQTVENYCSLVCALLSQIDDSGSARSVSCEQEAVQTLEHLVRDFLQDPVMQFRARLLTAEIYLKSGNRTMADQAARDAFGRFEKLDLSQQAELLDPLIDALEHSGVAQQVQDTRQLVTRQMAKLDWGRCNLMGMLSYRKGDFVQAYAQFCAADELHAGNPSVMLNLVQAGLELSRRLPEGRWPVLRRCDETLCAIQYAALGSRQRERCRGLWQRLEAVHAALSDDLSEPGLVILN